MNFLPALIPLFPLLGFAIVILAGWKLGWWSCLVVIGLDCVSLVIAFITSFRVLADPHGAPLAWSFEWLRWGDTALRMGVRIDALSAVMLFMVALVGTLITIYSIGYMAGDPRFSRFFAYLGLFMAGMLGLVVADNLLLLFVSWEIMGLCSYFLIGFWFEKPSAEAAGIKAFLTTRLGDVGLLLGMILLWWTAGSIAFGDLHVVIPRLAALGDPHIAFLLTTSAVLIFVGTIGKSAQFPLHVWLPDAMEGPTPVSALIHAATMVAAGVYLVARSFEVFVNFPAALQPVAYIGGFTCLFAAVIALTQNDIKRVLAYSTISQLGYMVMALGVGAYAAGIFHLLTHAFFKSLLFLGSGSVIIGCHHIQDLRQMGGLWKKMPITAWTFLMATLAIAGFPGFSGFWSKDEILLGAYHENKLLWVIGTVTVFLTAFYMFRLFFMAFTGEQRDKHVEPHETPPVMTVPLIILAVFAVLGGLPGSPLMGNWLQEALSVPAYHLHHHAPSAVAMGSSVALALAGILAAYLMYGPKPVIQPAKVAEALAPLYRLSFHKFYIDELYAWAIINPVKSLARVCFGFDQTVIDEAGVNGTGFSVRAFAYVTRFLTAGNLQWYAVTFLAGAVGLAIYALRALWA